MQTDVNTILARLQKGDSADAIANEFSTALNEAMRLNDVQIKEREAAAKAAARDALLNEKAEAILTALTDYIAAAAPDLQDELTGSDSDLYDVNSIRNIIDIAIEGTRASLSLANTLRSKAPTSSDDAISQFLKNFGL
jgi:hypothetical protein